MITVELHGLELFGKHGVLDHERRDGQMFLYDVSIEVADAPPSDRVEDTIDYRDIAECVREVSDGHAFQLLEALASAVADSVAERFAVERVRVRVRKPSPAGIPAEYAAATVERASA
jgi:dihydroneopterin aldolase / 2-amino-4-hydroxy-6-hydroxymethyldihydropteridine diphosphokinase